MDTAALGLRRSKAENLWPVTPIICTAGESELCSLHHDEPKPHLGPSVSLAKNAAAA